MVASFEEVRRPAFVLAFGCVVAVAPGLCRADAISDAAAALNRGDLPTAERLLREDLRVHPAAPAVLSLLGVVLDEEKKFQEADGVYARALALPHPSPGLLNNYGNHLSATGDTHRAQLTYEKVLQLEPAHPNANAQLARIDIEEKDYRGAMVHLDRLPREAAGSPAAALLRLQALYGLKRTADANALLKQLEEQGQSDPQWTFSLGLALAAADQFAPAEALFSRTLDAAPTNVDVLYNLGLAASRAGDRERALTVFEAAQKQRPDDVDLLYNLGALCAEMDRKEAAVAWLVQAARLDPQRADVQLLLAHTSADLGFGRDSLAAWDRYVQLKPNDDVAKRERAFEAANLGYYDESIAALKQYLQKHPDDAVAHYDLGAANLLGNPDEALRQFDRALVLKPDLVAALTERGLLEYQRNELPAALKDLQTANQLQSDNPVILDRLSQTYLLAGRVPDAVTASRKAAQLAPNDRQILLHYGLSLARSGNTAEAKQVMSRVREVKTSSQRNGGLVQFLSQTPQERYTDFRAKVEGAARENPSDMNAQMEYLRLLLDDGKFDEAAAVARRMEELNASSAMLFKAGDALLRAEQFPVAKEVLARAVSVEPTGSARLDLALATARVNGAAAGLQVLDAVPVDGRHAEFWVAEAKMLDAAGQTPAALHAIETAAAETPATPDVAREVTAFLVEHDRATEALQSADQAARSAPDNPNLQLIKVIALQLAAKPADATRLLSEIEHRWPEWSFPWLIEAIVLNGKEKYPGPRRASNAAITLGAQDAQAYACLAEATLHSVPEQIEAADAAITKALELDPEDPWSHVLAGRIDVQKKDHLAAIEQAGTAVKLAPELAATHAALAEAYRAAGQEQKAMAEDGEAQRLRGAATKPGDGNAELSSRLLRVLAVSN